MKNKTLAIFGIGTYILGVIASATDLEGNSTMPVALIAISGIVTAVFIVMAIIRLWKETKGVAIIFASSTLILYILSAIYGVLSPAYGSMLIILLNIAKVVNFIVFIWVIVKLFKINNTQIINQQTPEKKLDSSKEVNTQPTPQVEEEWEINFLPNYKPPVKPKK